MKKEIQPGEIFLIYYQILSTQIKKELYGDFKEILYFEREVKSEISTYVEGLQVHVKFHCNSRFQVLSR